MKLRDGLLLAAATAFLSVAAPAQSPPAAAEVATPAAEAAAPAAEAAAPAAEAAAPAAEVAAPAAEAKPPKPDAGAEKATKIVKPRPPAKPILLQKWAEIDADKDGMASYEDVTKVVPKFPLSRFNTFDKDQDKLLSRSELPRPGGIRKPQPKDAASTAAAAGLVPLIQHADKDKDGKVSTEEFKEALPNAPENQFKQLDINGDGTLDKGDLPPQKDPKGGFLRADADKDGKVSAAEFKAAFPKSPEDRFTKLDKNKDGFLDDADRALTAPPKTAANMRSPKEWSDVIRNFLAQSDADKDGKLSFEEFSKDKPGMERSTFDSLDTNKDGVIDINDKQPTGKGGMGKPARINSGSGAKERFHRADKNGDGKLTYEEAKSEFTNLTEESFKRRDTDGDGLIGPDDSGNRAAPKPDAATAPAPAEPVK